MYCDGAEAIRGNTVAYKHIFYSEIEILTLAFYSL